MRKRRPSPMRCRASRTRSWPEWAKSGGSAGTRWTGSMRVGSQEPLAATTSRPTWRSRRGIGGPSGRTRSLVRRRWSTVHESLIRRRRDHNNHLFALAGDSIYAEVARRGVPPLLGVFPTRCSRTQVSALHALLWAALVHVPREEFADRLRRRVAARGMDVAQRAVWLAAGLIASAREFTPAVVSFVEKGREPRARHILRFLVPGWLKRAPPSRSPGPNGIRRTSRRWSGRWAPGTTPGGAASAATGPGSDPQPSACAPTASSSAGW